MQVCQFMDILELDGLMALRELVFYDEKGYVNEVARGLQYSMVGKLASGSVGNKLHRALLYVAPRLHGYMYKNTITMTYPEMVTEDLKMLYNEDANVLLRRMLQSPEILKYNANSIGLIDMLKLAIRENKRNIALVILEEIYTDQSRDLYPPLQFLLDTSNWALLEDSRFDPFFVGDGRGCVRVLKDYIRDGSSDKNVLRRLFRLCAAAKNEAIELLKTFTIPGKLLNIYTWKRIFYAIAEEWGGLDDETYLLALRLSNNYEWIYKLDNYGYLQGRKHPAYFEASPTFVLEYMTHEWVSSMAGADKPALMAHFLEIHGGKPISKEHVQTLEKFNLHKLLNKPPS